MTQYIYLATSLPALRLGDPPEISFEEFEILLRENLLPWDYKQTQIIRRYFDILNMWAFWNKEPLDLRGNYDENDLEENILDRIGFPSYVLSFLEKYENVEERIKHYPELIANFFQKELREARGFVKDYLIMEREMRLVLLGFRAKLLHRDVTKELQYESDSDEIVGQILAQRDAKTYEPPEQYKEVATLFEEYHHDPLRFNQALCEYRFRKIDEMSGFSFFSFERIIAYMAQLILAEKWIELDKKKGLQIIDKIVLKTAS